MYPYFLFAAIHHLNRPRLSWTRRFDSHRGQNIFSLPRVVPWFPLLGLTSSGLFMGSISTYIYTSELILGLESARATLSVRENASFGRSDDVTILLFRPCCHQSFIGGNKLVKMATMYWKLPSWEMVSDRKTTGSSHNLSRVLRVFLRFHTK